MATSRVVAGYLVEDKFMGKGRYEEQGLHSDDVTTNSIAEREISHLDSKLVRYLQQL